MSEGIIDAVQALVRERGALMEVRGEAVPLGVLEGKAVEEELGDVVSEDCAVTVEGGLGVARALPLAADEEDALAVAPPAELAVKGEDALTLASAVR